MSSTGVVTQERRGENRANIVAYCYETGYFGGYIESFLQRCNGSSEVSKGHRHKTASYAVDNDKRVGFGISVQRDIHMYISGKN